MKGWLVGWARTPHRLRHAKSHVDTGKSQYAPIHRYIPSLPCELWLLIIREATITTSDPLDTSHCVSFLDYTPCSLEEYRASMRNKRRLSLVSRSWNALLQEVLFEFVWISRASQAKALAHTLLSQELCHPRGSSGRFIRRLHIETPTLERCAAVDLRTILDHAPQLIIYSDYRSVRRNRYDEKCDPRSSPEQLFSALAHPHNMLRRLAWTNYDHGSFHLHISPMLQATAANLECLELSFCSPHVPELSATGHDTSLAISLPALRSLKITLDDAAFITLAHWDMPALRNLSILSVDFSYASTGFANFFRVHGPKLRQLELGHSTTSIEEHYLTIPPHLRRQSQQGRIPLAEWCPDLREFICSADAEWNWQTPDWIAPHILLPTHPKLEFIGIRDIDKRLIDDASISPSTSTLDDAPFFPLLEQLASLLREEAFPSLRYIRDMSPNSERMRTKVPQARLIRFWSKVLKRCQERGVWLENWNGVNLTMRDMKRASLILTSGV